MSLFKSILLAGGALVAFAAVSQAADLPTKKAAPAAAKPNCYATFWTWLDSTAADCPLSAYGVTVYGTLDFGGGYMTNGTGFNRQYPTGVEELVSKNGNGGRWNLVPGGISQSVVGAKLSEHIFGDVSIVGMAETGFDPYTLQLANGPGSQVANNGNILQNQTGNGDSSRAGQIFNSQVNIGLSSKTFGTLLFGRVNGLTTDAVGAYDPMGGSYAFSPIGYSGATSGVGDTEDARYNTAFKYALSYNNLRASALVQVGGYEQGNASNGAYQVGVGADFYGFSVDGIFSHVTDAVALANFSTGIAIAAPALMGNLKATLSNDQSVMLVGKYTWGPLKLFAGYEGIQFYNPSDNFAGGFNSIGGITIPAGQVTSNAFIDTRRLDIMWIGAKYAIRDNIDITGAYYHYNQNNYNANPAANCGPNTTVPAPGFSPQGSAGSKCAGTLDAVSAMIDYRPFKRVDIYGGLMFSQVAGGLANGYLKSNNVDPTVGLRIKF